MIFASTGTKKPEDPPDKYVEAFAGSDILTNPPATNAWVAESGKTYARRIDELPPSEVLVEIDRELDMEHLERTLMEEGLAKFADPHKGLIELIGKQRAVLAR
jgi:transaldolase